MKSLKKVVFVLKLPKSLLITFYLLKSGVNFISEDLFHKSGK